mgnify:CR=1 FL=1
MENIFRDNPAISEGKRKLEVTHDLTKFFKPSKFIRLQKFDGYREVNAGRHPGFHTNFIEKFKGDNLSINGTEVTRLSSTTPTISNSLKYMKGSKILEGYSFGFSRGALLFSHPKTERKYNELNPIDASQTLSGTTSSWDHRPRMDLYGKMVSHYFLPDTKKVYFVQRHLYEAQRHHVELLKKLAIQKRTEDIPYFQDYEEIAQKLIFQPDRLEKMFALAMNPQDMFAMLKFEGAIEAFDDAYKESITTYTGRNILIDFFSCMWEHLPSNFFMGCYYYMVCYMSPLEGYKSHIYNYPKLVFVKTNLTEQQLVDQIKKEALGRFSPFGRDKKRAGIAIKKLMTSEGTIVERPMDSKQKVTVKISWNHTYYFT